jgi:chemotaxis protein CheY-P-specific phosphatase CheC
VNKTISVKELAKLIKVCKNEGVSRLKYGDIEVSIGMTENLPMTPSPQARGSAKKAEKIEAKAYLQMQYDEARVLAETLHVEDPAAFEKMLIDGEFSEAKEN